MTVLFRPASVAAQLAQLSTSAKDMLAGRDHQRLGVAASELTTWFESSRPGAFVWTVDEPIQTVLSRSYQGAGNAHALSACVTFRWECDRTEASDVAVASKGGTNVTLRRGGDDIGHYHFDLCAGGAAHPSPVPHAFSHAQVQGSTAFPRFPSMLLLPNDVLEMVLFELWPTDWPAKAATKRNSLVRHHHAQRVRLRRVTGAFRELAGRPFPLISMHGRVPAPINLF